MTDIKKAIESKLKGHGALSSMMVKRFPGLIMESFREILQPVEDKINMAFSKDFHILLSRGLRTAIYTGFSFKNTTTVVRALNAVEKPLTYMSEKMANVIVG